MSVLWHCNIRKPASLLHSLTNFSVVLSLCRSSAQTKPFVLFWRYTQTAGTHPNTYTHPIEQAQRYTLLAPHPCAMSRGRGGLHKDCQRFSLPPQQGKPPFHYHQFTGLPRGPRVPSPDSVSGRYPHPSLYSTRPGAPGVPPRGRPFHPSPSDPPLWASPQHGSDRIFDSYNLSFRQHQVQFLRGQSAQAPQFKAPQQRGSQTSDRGEEVSAGPIQYQADYRDFKSSGNSFRRGDGYGRGRGNWQREQNFGNTPGPRSKSHWNPHLQKGEYYPNQNTKHYWNTRVDDVSSGLRSLSLGDRVTRVDTSSCSSLASNVSSSPGSVRESLYLTPGIEQQVLTFLKSLRPDETVQARALGKKLGLPKKIVNKALYALLKTNQAKKQGENPPLWRLRKEQDSEPIKERDQTQSSKDSETKPGEKSSINQEATGNLISTSAPSESQILVEADRNSTDQSEDSEGEDTCETLLPDQVQKTILPAVQSVTLPTMADTKDSKDKILQYLYEAGTNNALVIAKNLGLRSAKQVNPTLYALEQQGDVRRDSDVTPHIWSLSAHQQEKMNRQRKVAANAKAGWKQWRDVELCSKSDYKCKLWTWVFRWCCSRADGWGWKSVAWYFRQQHI